MPQSEKMDALMHLAGEVAHELNNIFTAVTGNLSLLSEHVEAEGAPAGMIDEITRTAQRGIALSQKLQAFAGRQPLKRKQVDVNRVLTESVLELRRRLPGSIHVTLLPAARSCISHVDEEKLYSTFRELAANAVAAMKGGGTLGFEAAEVRIAPDNKLGLRPGAYVRIRVADSGRGMEPEVAARALEPLFSTKKAHINAGWGLSNCAGFLRQSGGCMHLHTSSGSGTAIELHLPVIGLVTA
jgi:C4-dicarboxylate-specific signal transduction histidine kinase